MAGAWGLAQMLQSSSSYDEQRHVASWRGAPCLSIRLSRAANCRQWPTTCSHTPGHPMGPTVHPPLMRSVRVQKPIARAEVSCYTASAWVACKYRWHRGMRQQCEPRLRGVRAAPSLAMARAARSPTHRAAAGARVTRRTRTRREVASRLIVCATRSSPTTCHAQVVGS